MTLFAWCSGTFQNSPKVCVEHLVHGKVVVTLERGATQIISLAESKLETVPTRCKCQNVQFVYIKQSNSFMKGREN